VQKRAVCEWVFREVESGGEFGEVVRVTLKPAAVQSEVSGNLI